MSAATSVRSGKANFGHTSPFPRLTWTDCCDRSVTGGVKILVSQGSDHIECDDPMPLARPRRGASPFSD